MPYITLFEITHEAIPLWIPFFPVIFGLFAVIFFLGTRDNPAAIKWFFRGFILLFPCVLSVFAAYYFVDQRRYVQAYQQGNYAVVEGPVEHYSWIGKHECFTVRDVEFCHGTANIVGWEPLFRFAPSTWPVGLAHEGLLVRVAYSPGEYPKMLRLDVAHNVR
jgi:hypothetical protein